MKLIYEESYSHVPITHRQLHVFDLTEEQENAFGQIVKVDDIIIDGDLYDRGYQLKNQSAFWTQ